MRARPAEVLCWLARMMGVYAAMSVPERAELHRWERRHLDGAKVGTSDWPGWVKYIGPRP